MGGWEYDQEWELGYREWSFENKNNIHILFFILYQMIVVAVSTYIHTKQGEKGGKRMRAFYIAFCRNKKMYNIFRMNLFGMGYV